MAFLKWFGKALIAFVLATAILSGFAYVYSYDGIHHTNPTGATDYVWRPNEHIATMTEGFAWLKMDEAGFNNAGIPDTVDVLFMGSSHTDDLHFSADKNAAVLTGELTGRSVYNVGMSGHTIYRCLDNLPAALATYQPEEFVVLETDTVRLNVDRMNEVLNGTALPNPSYESGIVYYMQLIPAFKPMYKQLDVWMSLEEEEEEQSSESSEMPEEYLGVLKELLARAGQQAREAGVTLIVYYHPPEKLMPDGTVRYKTSKQYLTAFSEACEEAGIVFVNMTESFCRLYNTQHLLAHGFDNTQIGEGHLNANGHKVIAEVLSELINQREVR